MPEAKGKRGNSRVSIPLSSGRRQALSPPCFCPQILVLRFFSPLTRALGTFPDVRIGGETIERRDGGEKGCSFSFIFARGIVSSAVAGVAMALLEKEEENRTELGLCTAVRALEGALSLARWADSGSSSSPRWEEMTFVWQSAQKNRARGRVRRTDGEPTEIHRSSCSSFSSSRAKEST